MAAATLPGPLQIMAEYGGLRRARGSGPQVLACAAAAATAAALTPVRCGPLARVRSPADDMRRHMVDGLFVVPDTVDLYVWHGLLAMSQGRYRGGLFRFIVCIHPTHPADNARPLVAFLDRPYHPLVDAETGALQIEARFASWRRDADRLPLVIEFVREVLASDLVLLHHRRNFNQTAADRCVDRARAAAAALLVARRLAAAAAGGGCRAAIGSRLAHTGDGRAGDGSRCSAGSGLCGYAGAGGSCSRSGRVVWRVGAGVDSGGSRVSVTRWLRRRRLWRSAVSEAGGGCAAVVVDAARGDFGGGGCVCRLARAVVRVPAASDSRASLRVPPPPCAGTDRRPPRSTTRRLRAREWQRCTPSGASLAAAACRRRWTSRAIPRRGFCHRTRRRLG